MRILDSYFIFFVVHLFVFSEDIFFFFNDTATTEIYTLSLHDALPISLRPAGAVRQPRSESAAGGARRARCARDREDRKSTRLNSSHSQISYAVFCLKKKNKYYNKLSHHS